MPNHISTTNSSQTNRNLISISDNLRVKPTNSSLASHQGVSVQKSSTASLRSSRDDVKAKQLIISTSSSSVPSSLQTEYRLTPSRTSSLTRRSASTAEETIRTFEKGSILSPSANLNSSPSLDGVDVGEMISKLKLLKLKRNSIEDAQKSLNTSRIATTSSLKQQLQQQQQQHHQNHINSLHGQPLKAYALSSQSPNLNQFSSYSSSSLSSSRPSSSNTISQRSLPIPIQNTRSPSKLSNINKSSTGELYQSYRTNSQIKPSSRPSSPSPYANSRGEMKSIPIQRLTLASSPPFSQTDLPISSPSSTVSIPSANPSFSPTSSSSTIYYTPATYTSSPVFSSSAPISTILTSRRISTSKETKIFPTTSSLDPRKEEKKDSLITSQSNKYDSINNNNSGNILNTSRRPSTTTNHLSALSLALTRQTSSALADSGPITDETDTNAKIKVSPPFSSSLDLSTNRSRSTSISSVANSSQLSKSQTTLNPGINSNINPINNSSHFHLRYHVDLSGSSAGDDSVSPFSRSDSSMSDSAYESAEEHKENKIIKRKSFDRSEEKLKTATNHQQTSASATINRFQPRVTPILTSHSMENIAKRTVSQIEVSPSTISSFSLSPISTSPIPSPSPSPSPSPFSPAVYSPSSQTVSQLSSSSIRSLCGLNNIGNTCFFNSILQCLFSIPSLLRYFASEEYSDDINIKSKTKGAISNSFSALCKQVADGNNNQSSINPSSLHRLFCFYNTMFAGYGQHDAQEFLRCFLSSLHDELNRIVVTPSYVQIEDKKGESDVDMSGRWWRNYVERNDSVCVDLFGGQLKSTIQCQVCDNISITFDPFWDLSLPIPRQQSQKSRANRYKGKNSEEKMKKKSSGPFSFFSRSRIFDSTDSDNSTDSDQSDAEIDSSPSINRRMNYTGSPSPASPISLFDCFDEFTQLECLNGNDQIYCRKCKKHQDSIKQLQIYRLPNILVLHLKRFKYDYISGTRTKVNTEVQLPTLLTLPSSAYKTPRNSIESISTIDGKNTIGPMYDLMAVSAHSGSTSGGHYIAHAVASSRRDYTNQFVKENRIWHTYNDSRVSRSSEDVLKSGSPYVLFYQRRIEK